MAKRRTLLIDADIFAFQAATIAEKPVDWGDGLWTLHAQESDAIRIAEDMIQTARTKLNGTHIILAFSDTTNWRMSVYPEYKGNRKKTRKPMLIPFLREYLSEQYRTFVMPTLEGDDVLGILSTSPDMVQGERVVVTLDKDLRTIPGLHARIGNYDRGIFEVTPDAADKFHLAQALAGDPTDGYPGCPGVAMGTALELMEDPHVLVPFERVITRGPRKGQPVTDYTKEPTTDRWACVLSYYRKAGFGEDYALSQARVARICRASDYDFEKEEVRLWAAS